jgi:hypothetical protein
MPEISINVDIAHLDEIHHVLEDGGRMNYLKNGAKAGMAFDLAHALTARAWITERVLELHASLPHVLGLFLSGTLAGRPRDQYSDLDFLVVYGDRGPSPADLERVRAALGAAPDAVRTAWDVSAEYGISTAFEVRQVETCLLYYDRDALAEGTRRYYAGAFRKTGAFYPGATVAALAENPILFERWDGQQAQPALQALKADAARFPDGARRDFCRRELGWFDYYLEKLEQFQFRRDLNGLQLTFAHAVDSILNVVFTLNAIPYAGPGKAFEAKVDRLLLRPEGLVDAISVVHTGFDSLGRGVGPGARSRCLERLLAETRTLAARVLDPPRTAQAAVR